MKKILLSSLLAVMAVTSANAKIASTGYADEVAQAKADAAQAAAATDATSKADAAQAAANTYTNEKIGALDSTTVTVGTNDGKYATVVTQADGKISTARVQFDGSIGDGSTALNAPTSLAVKTYVDRAITAVEGEIGEGYQKLDQKLTSTDPETNITPENRDLLYPSYAKAEAMVGAGVQSANAYAKDYTDDEIAALDSTVVTTGTNDGKYATVVTQTDGKISTARVQFDGSISDDSTASNAPTSLAVKTYVDRAITGVNGNVSGKVSINQGVANKDKGLIVNASGELELADVATDAELGTVSDIAAQAKAGVSDINNSDVMKSGITATKVATYDGYATGKQNALSDTQLAAVNSGITAAKVTAYDAYDDRIEQNKEKIAPIASAPVATEGEEEGQYVLTKKVVAGADPIYSWELIDRALAN